MLVKMYGSNLSIQGQIRRFKRLGGLGRGRNQERGGRNESSLGKGNLAVGFECMLGAIIHGAEVSAKICGAELGAMYSGAEVPATSTSPRISASHLGAKICGAETCYLGAMSPSADP